MTGGFVESILSLNYLPALLTAAILTWIFTSIAYKLYFHPLANIPGPKLAAITWLYQTYYSFVGGSRFYLRIEQLHHIYGTDWQNTSLAESHL